MRGAGGAPRGLRVHQKPLQKRERNRRPTRLPQNQNTKGITSADATKQATRSGRHKMPRRATKTGGRLATKAKKQASRRQIRLTNRIFVKPTNIKTRTISHADAPSTMAKKQASIRGADVIKKGKKEKPRAPSRQPNRPTTFHSEK